MVNKKFVFTEKNEYLGTIVCCPATHTNICFVFTVDKISDTFYLPRIFLQLTETCYQTYTITDFHLFVYFIIDDEPFTARAFPSPFFVDFICQPFYDQLIRRRRDGRRLGSICERYVGLTEKECKEDFALDLYFWSNGKKGALIYVRTYKECING